jgi:hypothetical protein
MMNRTRGLLDYGLNPPFQFDNGWSTRNVIFWYIGVLISLWLFLFLICSTIKRAFLGWVKDVRTTKSKVCGAQGGICKYIFSNPVACFLYTAEDLSAPVVQKATQLQIFVRVPSRAATVLFGSGKHGTLRNLNAGNLVGIRYIWQIQLQRHLTLTKGG